MCIDSSLNYSKYDFSTTTYSQSPTSLENTATHNNYECKLLYVTNTSLDLNIEKRVNEKTDKKINITKLPTEILNKIFSYTGESKANARLTCHRFNDCVRLNKEELFKIKNGGFLFMNGFNLRSINYLARQEKENQDFVLKHCTLLHKSGFSSGLMIFLSKQNVEKREFVLNNCGVLHDSGFLPGIMIFVSSMDVERQEFLLEQCKTQNDKKLDPWGMISITNKYTYLMEKVKRGS